MEKEDEEFGRIVYGVYDRVYLLKTCIERDVETVGEYQAVCRELQLTDYLTDKKVIRALTAWHDLWHGFELPDIYNDTDK